MKRRVLTVTIILASTLVLVSCDIVYQVAFHNYGHESSKVVVEYQGGLWDNDTLSATRFESEFDTMIIRTNIDSNTYYFTAPIRSQVTLQPKSIGTPITKISFETEADTTVTVELFGENWKKLRKEGVVETKGFYFIHTILINRQ